MTKEEAKHLSEVLKAYSEDKELEYLTMDGEWVPKRTPNFDANPFNYRIKPELKYRPYKSAEEFLKAMTEHGPMLRLSFDNMYFMPLQVSEESNYVVLNAPAYASVSFDKLIHYDKWNWVWQDGTPCGIIE